MLLAIVTMTNGINIEIANNHFDGSTKAKYTARSSIKAITTKGETAFFCFDQTMALP